MQFPMATVKKNALYMLLYIYPELPYKYVSMFHFNYNFTIIVPNAFNYLKNVTTWEHCSVEL
jgi:hypothetical protein